MSRDPLKTIVICLLLAGCGQHSTEPDGEKCLCPAATLSLSPVDVMRGQSVAVDLRMSLSHDAVERLDSIGFLDLRIVYDRSALSFLDAEAGTEIRQWEWFTYRHVFLDTMTGALGSVNILAVRDLDNGPDRHPIGQHLPEGTLIELKFYVTADRSYIGTCALIQFAVLDCFDNCLGSVSGNSVYVPNLEIGSVFLGPDYDPDACAEEYREDHATVQEVLASRAGKVCIREPIDDRPMTGDLNLNGIPFEIADAIIFAEYLIYGESALDPDPKRRRRQELAGDIDSDGHPLTQADWDMMVRIIEGGP